MEYSLMLITKKFLLTILLAGLIGCEREMRNKGAGLRTHILVAVSASLVTIISFYLFNFYATMDPSRMLHGIITGIGFLCAGTIIRAGNNISGLTTAASLWTVACIGIAVGIGQFAASIIFTMIVVFVLIGIGYVERSINKKRETKNGVQI